MKKIIITAAGIVCILIIIFSLSDSSKNTPVDLGDIEPEIYHKIEIKPVFSKLFTRDKADRVYSGQIKSETGLAEFEKAYGIDVNSSLVSFDGKMLIFGITDNISSRAFQFLRQENIRTFTLDYAETGIKYKLRMPEEGQKHSYMQVFVLDKIEGISHIRVKNTVSNGLSRVYDKQDQ